MKLPAINGERFTSVDVGSDGSVATGDYSRVDTSLATSTSG